MAVAISIFSTDAIQFAHLTGHIINSNLFWFLLFARMPFIIGIVQVPVDFIDIVASTVNISFTVFTASDYKLPLALGGKTKAVF